MLDARLGGEGSILFPFLSLSSSATSTWMFVYEETRTRRERRSRQTASQMLLTSRSRRQDLCLSKLTSAFRLSGLRLTARSLGLRGRLPTRSRGVSVVLVAIRVVFGVLGRRGKRHLFRRRAVSRIVSTRPPIRLSVMLTVRRHHAHDSRYKLQGRFPRQHRSRPPTHPHPRSRKACRRERDTQ